MKSGVKLLIHLHGSQNTMYAQALQQYQLFPLHGWKILCPSNMQKKLFLVTCSLTQYLHLSVPGMVKSSEIRHK